MSPVLELTRELISRPSLTPEDAGCQRLIAERLARAGFDVDWFYCEDVSNVLITKGLITKAQGNPSLWFLGHTDVVPTGPETDWVSPPFQPEVRDGVLYGRGAADMKGAVAAMVVALERWAGENPDHPGQAGLLLTSDEEGLAINGVQRVAKLLAERGTVPDYCLVGEPSSVEKFGDTVRIGRRGSISAKLVVNGIQGHTAFPHTIDNPVHRLAPFLAELVTTHWDDGDADFPSTHCQVSNFNAGTGAENVSPGQAELMFNFRNAPGSPSAELRKRVEDMLKRHQVTDYDLNWRIGGEPFRSRAGALRIAMVAAIEKHLHLVPDLNTGGGTSDGRFIAPLGTEVLEFGLLNHSIHKVNENTQVKDLERLADIYSTVLNSILNR